jgi:putative salt-induced outer membrane protein YdiY
MNRSKKLFLAAAGMLAVAAIRATAQPQVVTVTNYVTVVLTNVVTITNFTTLATNALAVRKPALPVVAKHPWENSITTGLTLTRGNSQTLLFAADFVSQRKTPTDEYKLGLGGAYGDQNSTETVNNYKAFGQWNHLFADNFFVYTRADALRDLIAAVDYRLTVGPGAGYYFIKSTNTTLAVELGAAYEAQSLNYVDQDFATARLAERFEHKFTPGARVWESVEFLPQMENFDNFLVNGEIGLEASLTKTFSVKTYLDDSYQNIPAAGKLSNDAKIIAAIAYKF